MPGFTRPISSHFIARTAPASAASDASTPSGSVTRRKNAAGCDALADSIAWNHASATNTGTTGSANRASSHSQRLTRRIGDGSCVSSRGAATTSRRGSLKTGWPNHDAPASSGSPLPRVEMPTSVSRGSRVPEGSTAWLPTKHDDSSTTGSTVAVPA